MPINQPLARAIAIAGSQAALARKLGVVQSIVSRWLHHNPLGVPGEYCPVIERETGVCRHELRPDLWDVPVSTETTT